MLLFTINTDNFVFYGVGYIINIRSISFRIFVLGICNIMDF